MNETPEPLRENAIDRGDFLKIKTSTFANGDITLETLRKDFQGFERRISLEIMRTKEAAFREALISLGWTPPPEGGPSTATTAGGVGG